MNKMYWVTGIIGVLLVIAPFVLGFTANPAALWTSVILGAAVVIVSLIKGLVNDTAQWEYWLVGLFGLAAIVAPFVLGFSNNTRSEWTSIILGALAIIFSAYQIFYAKPGTPQH
jgi:bacteriorhodopsin